LRGASPGKSSGTENSTALQPNGITEQYVKVDAHMLCPSGYATIHERESCVAAANAKLDFLCYNTSWENGLRTESSPQMPAGCYFDTAAGGGCALNLNSASSEASSCPEGYQCSRLCEKKSEQYITVGMVSATGTWSGRNCYTEDSNGAWHGAYNIGGSYGIIGRGGCSSQCQQTWDCTCYVVSNGGECWMRKNCQYSACVADNYYTTYVTGHVPTPPPSPSTTWWGRNCYTDDSNGAWHGAQNIGGSYGKIGDGGCSSKCQQTWDCTCYVVSNVGECWLRSNCQYSACVSDGYYNTIKVK
jgi:hypothetical protein